MKTSAKRFFRGMSLLLLIIAITQSKNAWILIVLAQSSHGMIALALYGLASVYIVGHGVCIVGLWQYQRWALLVSMGLIVSMTLLLSMLYCPCLTLLLTDLKSSAAWQPILLGCWNGLIVLALLIVFRWTKKSDESPS